MEAFAGAYDPARLTGLHGIVAIAASHHRLLWIHPFLDGNVGSPGSSPTRARDAPAWAGTGFVPQLPPEDVL